MANRFIGLTGGVLALVLFLAVNVLSNASLRPLRLDLTEESLYTLSEGSRSIASNLDEPIRLYYFFSKDAAREIPSVVDYGNRVRDVLDAYERYSNGNILLEEIDPEPFSEAEDRATREGISAIPIGRDPLYFGLVGTNSTEGREVIPFFGSLARGSLDFASRERFLEYDLSRLIYTLAHPEKKRVGVLSALPIHGATPNPTFNQPPAPPWKILSQIERFYDVVRIDTSDTELPADLDALVVVHPRQLSEALLYGIDQYVMGGGRLLAFVDPHCELDSSMVDPSNPMSAIGAERDSDLNQLFHAWGFEVTSGKVAGDRKHAAMVRDPSDQRGSGVSYVIWMQLGNDRMNAEDPVSSTLQQLFLVAPGTIRALDGSTTSLESLVRTSEESMEIDVGRLQSYPDPGGLLESFVPGQKELTLAARISGPAASAFPEGKPAGLDAAPIEGEESGHLSASTEPIQVIAVADADLLYDRYWLQEDKLFGQTIGFQEVSDNCNLMLNCIENLTGGEDLISIRARGQYTRPFERVEEIRREAELKFRAEEQVLEEQMQAAERTIAKLQQERDPSSPDSMMLFSPAQREAYDQAMTARSEARVKLRDVRHSMDKDIESLGSSLKLINIFAMPLIVSIAALALGAVRMSRRGS